MQYINLYQYKLKYKGGVGRKAPENDLEHFKITIS